MPVPTSGINLPHAPRRYRPEPRSEALQSDLSDFEGESGREYTPEPESAAEPRESPGSTAPVSELSDKTTTSPRRRRASKKTAERKTSTKATTTDTKATTTDYS